MRTMIVSLIVLLLIASPTWAGGAKKHEQGESESKVHIHGYGELHYSDPIGGGFPDETKPASLDFHRLVWGVSYTLNNHWSLHTEIDFEHAAQELELEFGYVEYRSQYPLGFRIGSMLMPVGPLNEYHEPPLFYSVERPYVQKFIIPTTWNAAGFGIFGVTESGFKYRLYLVEGLNAAKFDDKNGIRDGRQLLSDKVVGVADKVVGVAKASNNADKFGGVGRLEYTGFPGLGVGVSYYNSAAVGVANAGVTLWDVDLRYKAAGFDLSLLSAKSKIKGAKAISTAVGKTVGEEQTGQYGEIAYHLNHLIKSMPDIVPFYRLEQFNTQENTAGADNKLVDQEVQTYGLAYFPDPNIAIKVDHERWENGKHEKADRTNIGVGFMF